MCALYAGSSLVGCTYTSGRPACLLRRDRQIEDEKENTWGIIESNQYSGPDAAYAS